MLGGCIIWSKQGEEKVLEVTFLATNKKGRTEDERLLKQISQKKKNKNKPRPWIGGNNSRQMIT